MANTTARYDVAAAAAGAITASHNLFVISPVIHSHLDWLLLLLIIITYDDANHHLWWCWSSPVMMQIITCDDPVLLIITCDDTEHLWRCRVVTGGLSLPAGQQAHSQLYHSLQLCISMICCVHTDLPLGKWQLNYPTSMLLLLAYSLGTTNLHGASELCHLNNLLQIGRILKWILIIFGTLHPESSSC